MKNAFLVSGIRTPFAKAGTQLTKVHAAELGRHALSELMARTEHSVADLGNIIDEVIIGNAGTPADSANISRVVALNAGLSERISAYTVHRNCASGMEAIAQAALKIQAGVADVIIAGGTESMSQAPLIYNQNATDFFAKMARAKTVGAKAKLMTQLPLKDFLAPRISIMEGLKDPTCGLNMGQTAEVLAKEYKISREAQDEFALRSHQRAVEATKNGVFNDEIAPFPIPPKYSEVMEQDSGPRAQQSLEALGKLKPYFDRKFGTVTPGNACPITDGAAMTLIASEEGLKKLEMAALAKIKSYGFAGLDPKRMGLGPVYATHKVLEDSGLNLGDFGNIEINEAFAAQVMACLMAMDSDEFCSKELGRSSKIGAVDIAKLNPNGGAIALGHPVGATGTRLVLTAAHEMRRSGAEHALATLCIGGGQGGAVILEAVNS